MPPSRATLPSSPRFSVEHRRELVLPSPSLSLSLENDRFLSSSLLLSHPVRRLFDSARFSLSSLSLWKVSSWGREKVRRGRGFNASMTFDHRVPPPPRWFFPVAIVVSRHSSPREDCITPERESIRLGRWIMMVDRRWDDRSRAAKGDCAGKRSNVRRLDRAESGRQSWRKKIVVRTGAWSKLTTNRNGCSEMRQDNGDVTVIRKRDIVYCAVGIASWTDWNWTKNFPGTERAFYYLFI